MKSRLIKPKLSYDEYVISKNLDGMFKWITRDELGEAFLTIHTDKPMKKHGCWSERLGRSIGLPFGNLFQFIRWEDKKPYNIQELLEEYESYHSDN